ncbi:MAG TPA: regulatory iron-sulfur-containing complex subunit RicT, partial [Gemmatimonadaceae bacterium]|nr:regulatory iron-sulfur-containing complex subunit RicT [Gemmatimonadaceae bacterium]
YVPHLIEVAFRGNRNEFYLWELDPPPALRAAVIVDADRGEDLGRVHAVGELAARRCAGTPHGLGPDTLPEKRALRLATPEEVRRADELADENETARRKAMERVKANGLVMKLSDAEWQWDRKKLTFYFTAEKRVDFRNLVRDLASMFRTRIELKQIGVRDEAKRLDGVGRCGRRYCSASWLPELRPVNLGVAKDQRLSLNPSQISGACGRLMCCLRYEHEFYVQSRKRFPKEGKILVTSLGEEKVVANDIFHDRVTLRRPDGDARVVALADLKREVAAAAVPDGDASALAAAAAAIGQGDDDAASSLTDDTGEHTTDVADDRDAESAIAAAAAAERRQESRRTRAPERRPRTSERTANGVGNGTGNGVGGGEGEPRPAATPAPGAAAGAWLRQRSPLPQVAASRETTAAAPATPPPAPTTTPAVIGGVGADEATDASSEAPTTAAAAAVPTTGEESSDQRRTRRRRGRRGGRRGRGGDRGGAGAASDGQGTTADDDAGASSEHDDDGADSDASASDDRTTDHRTTDHGE